MTGIPMSHKRGRAETSSALESFPATVSNDDLEPALDQLFGDQGGGFIVIFDAKDFLARICHAAYIPRHKQSPRSRPTFIGGAV